MLNFSLLMSWLPRFPLQKAFKDTGKFEKRHGEKKEKA